MSAITLVSDNPARLQLVVSMAHRLDIKVEANGVPIVPPPAAPVIWPRRVPRPGSLPADVARDLDQQLAQLRAEWDPNS